MAFIDIITFIAAKKAALKHIANKLTEPSSMAVGKYFRIASIDANGHAVLECVNAPSAEALTGTTAPTTSTVGYVGQTYIDTVKNAIYQCIAVNNGSYTWSTITSIPYRSTAGESIRIIAPNYPYSASPPAGGDGGICVAITPRSGSAQHRGSIAVGADATARGYYSIAIGMSASTAGGFSGVAIGELATCTQGYAAQLGNGTNSKSHTLQFETYRLVDDDGTIPPERITSQNWTDAQRLAVLQSLGCTVDNDGYVKWTAQPTPTE